VRHNVNGLQFRAGSAESLVDRLVDALRNRELWDRLRVRIPEPPTHVEAAERHLSLYRDLLAQKAGTSQDTAQSGTDRSARRLVAAAE
jgi:hypothetical protein